MLKDTTNAELYYRTHGRMFRVVALADNANEANAHMLANAPASVIDVRGDLVIMADKDDEGELIK